MEYRDATDIVAGLHGVLDKVETKIRGSWVHRVFWHSVRVKWYTPPVLAGASWELDHPYRKGYTLIVRYWWRRSLVLGFWGKRNYGEDHALLNATIHGRKRTQDERDAWDETKFQEFEPSIADKSADFDLDVLTGEPRLRIRATTDAGVDGE